MKNNSGFTLIEVVIAMAILAGASIALYQSWSGSFSAVKKGRNYNTVSLLLQRKVAEFEVASRKLKADEVEDQSGDFGSDFPDYRWEIKAKPFNVPNLLPPNPDGTDQLTETIVKTLTDYFEKAVREVSVTVIWKTNKRELKYSISTIFVDFNQELPLGI